MKATPLRSVQKGDVLLRVGTRRVRSSFGRTARGHAGNEGKLRVYRTQDAGESWKPLSKGLPQEGAFETVLRDALAVDPLPSAGVYFGTRSGKVYGSTRDGDRWELVAYGLPAVVCVKTATIGEVGAERQRAKRKVPVKAKAKKAAPARRKAR